MSNILRAVGAASAGLLLSTSMVTPAHAEGPCMTGEQVRDHVAGLVAELRPEVPSSETRTAIRAALIETVATFGGERAATAQERRALGEEISALARTLRDTDNRVRRSGLALEIMALTEQRERGRFTAEEHKELRGAYADLRRAVVRRVDDAEQRSSVADSFRTLAEQLSCHSA